MKKALIDVPVLLLFFVRPDTFRKVFEQVKEARPSKLFLFQDGAREGRPGDAEKIEECRKIAEDIDWECEVHTYYSEKNLTCDHAEYTAISWAKFQLARAEKTYNQFKENGTIYSWELMNAMAMHLNSS